MAVVLTAALFVHGGEQPSYADKPVVIAGVVKDSPAQKAGIQAGDRIVSFAGVKESDLGSRGAGARAFRARALRTGHDRSQRPA